MACPSCNHPGKGVKRVTLDALLVDPTLAGDGFRHCPAKGCDVAYFHGDGRTILKDQVKVAIGTKEGRGLLCYCFGHSYESITAEPMRDVVAEISAACQAGEDDCRRKNPQGSCCLGNIRQVVGGAANVSGEAEDAACCSKAATACCGDEADACCSKSTGGVTQSGDKRGLFSVLGAALLAIMASACCWLPLLLIAFGTSATAAAGFFAAYRGVLLVLTAAFLAAGFYFVYFRRRSCEPGGVCSISPLQRWSRIGLWVSSAIVVGFAFLPNYIAGLSPAATVVANAGTAHVFVVDGMTCEGCAHHIESSLRQVAGVTAATVSYADKTATAFADDNTSDDALIAAIEDAGYKARRRR